MAESESKLPNLPVTPLKSSRAGAKGRPIMEVVMTIILRNHPDHDYYEEYGFLDYLAVVLNAVSAELVIETHVGGSIYRLKCARGAVVEPLRRVGPSSESGTCILFRADPEVFAVSSLDVETVRLGLQQLAKDYPQIRFILRDGNSNLVEVTETGA